MNVSWVSDVCLLKGESFCRQQSGSLFISLSVFSALKLHFYLDLLALPGLDQAIHTLPLFVVTGF